MIIFSSCTNYVKIYSKYAEIRYLFRHIKFNKHSKWLKWSWFYEAYMYVMKIRVISVPDCSKGNTLYLLWWIKMMMWKQEMVRIEILIYNRSVASGIELNFIRIESNWTVIIHRRIPLLLPMMFLSLGTKITYNVLINGSCLLLIWERCVRNIFKGL